LPFTEDVKAFVEAHERVYVVEQNRDGQMGDLLRLEVGDIQHKLRKILHYTGLPCDARSITDSLLQMENDGTRIVRIGLGAAAMTQTISED
jgi:2-oxoglutarate ferredoxin oxidoreductase subunit alpha